MTKGAVTVTNLARISHTDQWKGGQSVMPGFENREEVNIASIDLLRN